VSDQNKVAYRNSVKLVFSIQRAPANVFTELRAFELDFFNDVVRVFLRRFDRIA
jgi:hypothetical protein